MEHLKKKTRRFNDKGRNKIATRETSLNTQIKKGELGGYLNRAFAILANLFKSNAQTSLVSITLISEMGKNFRVNNNHYNENVDNVIDNGSDRTSK